MQKHGIILVSSDNGEFETKVPEGASDDFARRLLAYNADACDEARIYLRTPDAPEKLRWAYLVLGNEPHETIADYSGAGPALDAVLDEFSEEWEMKKCPVMAADAPYQTKAPTK